MVGNGITIKKEKSTKQTSDINICFMENETIISVREEGGKIKKTVVKKTKMTKIKY